MSAVNPNNNCGILIDEFIKMATEHLQTVEGAIFTLASYSPAGQILPSQVAWKGYFITPTQREIDLGQGFAIAELNTNYKAGEKKSLNPDIFAIAEDTGEQSETGVVYPNLNKADGTAIKNFGNTAMKLYIRPDNSNRLQDQHLVEFGILEVQRRPEKHRYLGLLNKSYLELIKR